MFWLWWDWDWSWDVSGHEPSLVEAVVAVPILGIVVVCVSTIMSGEALSLDISDVSSGSTVEEGPHV